MSVCCVLGGRNGGNVLWGCVDVVVGIGVVFGWVSDGVNCGGGGCWVSLMVVSLLISSIMVSRSSKGLCMRGGR